MKLIMEIKPIGEAPRDGTVIMSWWDNRPVFIAWCKQTRTETEVVSKWYKLGLPEIIEKEIEDGSFWTFTELRQDGKWYNTKACGYFIPIVWTRLPLFKFAEE